MGAPWGVHGWLKVESFTEPPAALLDYGRWRLVAHGALAGPGDGARWVTPEAGRPHGKNVLLVRLPGVDSPEAARAYTTMEIWVPRAALPPVGPKEYYWVDLIGLEVTTLEGVSLGRVSHFVELPANPVLVAKDGRKEHWVPMAPEHVRRVDLAAGRVVVDWDPEL